jgi:hypothetical protein
MTAANVPARRRTAAANGIVAMVLGGLRSMSPDLLSSPVKEARS